MKVHLSKTNHFPVVGFILLLVMVYSAALAEMSPMPPRLVGTILDSETGEPISNAHVYLENSSEGIIVTENGTFEFVNVPSGMYTLSISHITYYPEQRSVDLKEGVPLFLTVHLSPRILENEPVVYSRKSEDQAYTVNIDDIKNSSWSDVGDAMASIPSAQVYKQGGLGSRKTVSFHGAKPEQVLVLIDGIALNSGDGKAVDLAEIPLNNVQSILVEPEASPGAAGGTISIITRSISSAIGRKTDRSLSVEGQEPEAISLVGTIDSGNESGYTGFTVRHISNTGEYDYTDENGDTNQRYNNQRKRTSFSMRLKNNLTENIDFGVMFFGENYSSGVPGPLYQPPTTDASLKEESLNGRIFIERNSENRINRLTLSGFTRKREYRNPLIQYNPEIDSWVYHTPQDIYDFNEVYQLQYMDDFVGKDKFDIAFESSVRLEKFSSENHLENGAIEDRLVGDIHRTWYYGSLKSELKNHFRKIDNQLLLHLRFDSYGDNEGSFSNLSETSGWSGKAGYSLTHPNSGLSWNVFVTRAYSPPSFVSRFLVESAFTFGNPELKPEKVEELTSGLHYTKQISDGNFTISLRGFLRHTEDKIVWRRNWRGQYFPDNLEEAIGRGFDTFAEWFNSNGQNPIEKIGFNLTVQDIRNSTKSSHYYDNIVPFQPNYLGSVYLTLNTLYDIKLMSDLRFSGRRYSMESNLDIYTIAGNGLEPYQVLNVFANREWMLFNSLIFKGTLGVENITNEEYELLERMPMPGRIWRIKLEIRS